MRFASGSAAHLAGEAITIENKGACLFRDRLAKDRPGLRILQQILSGTKTAIVLVGENIKALNLAELTDASSPLANSANLPEGLGIEYLPNVAQEVRAKSVSRAG